jgi:hypothetical protein
LPQEGFGVCGKNNLSIIQPEEKEIQKFLKKFQNSFFFMGAFLDF